MPTTRPSYFKAITNGYHKVQKYFSARAAIQLRNANEKKPARGDIIQYVYRFPTSESSEH
jgi:hypothetical protein